MPISKSVAHEFHALIAFFVIAVLSGYAADAPPVTQPGAPLADGGAPTSQPVWLHKKRRHLRRTPDRNPAYGTITLRQASLFHEQLLEFCEGYWLGLHYHGALGAAPITQGASHSWDPTLWTIGDVPNDFRLADGKQPFAGVIVAIRLDETKPQAGVWAPVTLDGRRFYALLDEVNGPKADAAIDAFGGRTPRDILEELGRAFDASN